MNGETNEILTTEETGGTETGGTETGGTETGFAEAEAADGAERRKAGPEARQPANRDDGSAAAGEESAAAQLRAALSRAEERVIQLERERTLLSQGVPEEDLDYYVFKIGKLVNGEKDFDTAAKEFLKQHGAARRAPAPRSTGASLAGRASSPRSTNDTMNRILRGN